MIRALGHSVSIEKRCVILTVEIFQCVFQTFLHQQVHISGTYLVSCYVYWEPVILLCIYLKFALCNPFFFFKFILLHFFDDDLGSKSSKIKKWKNSPTFKSASSRTFRWQSYSRSTGSQLPQPNYLFSRFLRLSNKNI